jgi:hypothetical protein
MAKPSTKGKGTIAEKTTDVQQITRSLSAPFDSHEVKFKPAVVSGNRALALAYVDARVIQDRLDEVLGVEGWQDNYKVLEDGTVVCRLQLRLGDQWVTKVDVGSPSEQGDSGDRRKAAFSDALKRAAVKFGIGRYLYRLPTQWVDYDPQRKQISQTPRLPAWALPEKPAPATTEKTPAAALEEPVAIAAVVEKKPTTAKSHKEVPANGVELQRRLYDYDAKLAKAGLCAQGDLVRHVVAAGTKAGYEADLSTWAGDAILLAAEATRAFEARARSAGSKQRDVA